MAVLWQFYSMNFWEGQNLVLICFLLYSSKVKECQGLLENTVLRGDASCFHQQTKKQYKTFCKLSCGTNTSNKRVIRETSVSDMKLFSHFFFHFRTVCMFLVASLLRTKPPRFGVLILVSVLPFPFLFKPDYLKPSVFSIAHLQ